MNGFHDVIVADDPSIAGVLTTADYFEPQIVLLDLEINGAIAVPLVAHLGARGIKVLVLTPMWNRGDLLAECIEAGAGGVFDKRDSFENFLAFLLDAASGMELEPSNRQELLATLRIHRAENKTRMRPFELLSSRERTVLMSLTEGRSAEEIAALQFVSIATIRTQIRGILQKLGVTSQLAAVALAHGAHWENAAR